MQSFQRYSLLSNELQCLDIPFSEMQTLTDDELLSLAHRRYLKLALLYHPDKNPHNQIDARLKFDEIKAAHESLREKLKGNNKNDSGYQADIDTYFKYQRIHIPDNTFDLLLVEQIENAYRTLSRDFKTLNNEADKVRFAQEHSDFYNLAKTVEASSAQFYKQLPEELRAHTEASFLKKLKLNWRALIITQFGEEYLDDFQYRTALGTGSLYPILATRKILSPVKIAAFIIQTTILVLAELYNASMTLLFTDTIQRFKNLYHAPDKYSFLDFSIVALKIMGISFLIGYLPAVYFPELYSIAISIPLFSRIVDLIASPVNNIVRPLANYWETSPLLVSGLLIAAGAAMLYSGAFAALTLSSLDIVAEYLLLPVVIFNLALIVDIHINLYRISPETAISSAAYTATNFALSIYDALSDTTPRVIQATLPLLFQNLSVTSLLYTLNQFIKNIREELAKITEELPLPTKPVPDVVRNATLSGVKTATRSHRFFNTPKHAEYIEPEHRSIYQQCSSFFGGGTVNRPKQQFVPSSPKQALPTFAPTFT